MKIKTFIILSLSIHFYFNNVSKAQNSNELTKTNKEKLKEIVYIVKRKFDTKKFDVDKEQLIQRKKMFRDLTLFYPGYRGTFAISETTNKKEAKWKEENEYGQSYNYEKHRALMRLIPIGFDDSTNSSKYYMLFTYPTINLSALYECNSYKASEIGDNSKLFKCKNENNSDEQIKLRINLDDNNGDLTFNIVSKTTTIMESKLVSSKYKKVSYQDIEFGD